MKPTLHPATLAPTPTFEPPKGLEEGWLERTLRETELLARYPQYAGVLARIDPIETTNVHAMAIAARRLGDPSSRLVLLVNPDYFAAHPEESFGVLLHELQHVVLGHLHDELLHRVTYPRLVEIAMEISADEPIRELISDHGYFIERFAKYGIAAGQSTTERYVLLRDAYERGELKIEDHWQPNMRDTHRLSDARFASMGDLIDARSDGATDRLWARGEWGLGAPSSRALLEKMQRRIQKHLLGERGGAGLAHLAREHRPKELTRVIDHRLGGDRLAWPRILRQVFASERRVMPDARRPNRRFPDRIGEIPGRVRRSPPPHLMAVLDTSGSMTVDVLGRIIDELEALRRHARIDVLEADAVVHRTYPLRSRPLRATGGGDTDFGPALAEVGRRRDIDGVLYFTDGRGVMPTAAPRVPLLWVLTHDEPFEPPLGTVVRLPVGRSAKIRGARAAMRRAGAGLRNHR
jgi:predicted metal-dependent peptidase